MRHEKWPVALAIAFLTVGANAADHVKPQVEARPDAARQPALLTRESLLGVDADGDGIRDDIEAIALNCRFRDCAHVGEPGCAVQAAIEDGTLDEARYDHYVKLRDEQEAAATTLAQRRSEERVMNKALNKRLKDKYGRR